MPEPAALAAAFRRACELDVEARKPGNVSWASAGHRMQAPQFVASATAAAPHVTAAGQPVGVRIEAAMRATLAAVGCNTNLGIVLLATPLLAAAGQTEAPGEPALRAAVTGVLGSLTRDDAEAAYRAIALTQPAGLGRVAQQDVQATPSVTLRLAMALAAERDRIARQYAWDFEDLFDTLRPAYGAALSVGHPASAAMQRVFLLALARWPDSHIVRKHGAAAAHTVMREAQDWVQRLGPLHEPDADPAWATWDESLKARGLNPGTSADLSVATALLHELLQPHMPV